jgi:hypothetical protein
VIPPHDKRALENLRQLSALALSDLEATMGGSLTPAAQTALRGWLARAFEAGDLYGYERGINDPSRVPTVRPPKSRAGKKSRN